MERRLAEGERRFASPWLGRTARGALLAWALVLLMMLLWMPGTGAEAGTGAGWCWVCISAVSARDAGRVWTALLVRGLMVDAKG